MSEGPEPWSRYSTGNCFLLWTLQLQSCQPSPLLPPPKCSERKFMEVGAQGKPHPVQRVEVEGVGRCRILAMRAGEHAMQWEGAKLGNRCPGQLCPAFFVHCILHTFKIMTITGWKLIHIGDHHIESTNQKTNQKDKYIYIYISLF